MLILKGQKIFKTDDAWYRYWRESRQKSRDSATRIYEGFVMATVLLGPFQQKITKAQKDSWNDHYWWLCGVWSFFGSCVFLCLFIDSPTRSRLSSMPLSGLALSYFSLCCVFFVFDYFFVILLIWIYFLSTHQQDQVSRRCPCRGGSSSEVPHDQPVSESPPWEV